MDARFWRVVTLLAALSSFGAGFRTPNFIVTAERPEFAEEVARAAEHYRRELAIEWLGEELPQWAQPCPLAVQTGPQLGASGATTFSFDRGQVFGWHMTIQGSEERVLDSVLPHEVNHTIFATYFRQPLPRWADEGACTVVEHPSERLKQQKLLIEILQTGRGIAFNQMFHMKEYPRDVMPLYSQGYSLTRYLIDQGGKKKFIAFVRAGLDNGDWPGTVQKFYEVDSLAILQDQWVEWVRQGSPLSSDNVTQVAAVTPAAANEPTEGLINPPPPHPELGHPEPRKLSPAAVAQAVPLSSPQNMARSSVGSPAGSSRPAPRQSPLNLANNWPEHAAAGTPPRAVPQPPQPLITAPTGAAPAGTLPPDGWVAVGNKYPRTAGTSNQAVNANQARTPARSSLPPSNANATGSQHARPQPIETTRQTVLEWSRDDTLRR